MFVPATFSGSWRRAAEPGAPSGQRGMTVVESAARSGPTRANVTVRTEIRGDFMAWGDAAEKKRPAGPVGDCYALARALSVFKCSAPVYFCDCSSA